MVKDYLITAAGGAVFFIIGPCVMILLTALGPEDFLPSGTFTLGLSAVTSAFGVFFTLWAVIEMAKKGDGCPVVFGRFKLTKETSKLVTTGPYALCRNPMHLGIFFYLLGFACFLNSLWSLIVPLAMLIFAWITAVVIDEPRLMRDFEKEFVSYRLKVPRFLPQIKWH